jgi:hypothetical protein
LSLAIDGASVEEDPVVVVVELAVVDVVFVEVELEGESTGVVSVDVEVLSLGEAVVESAAVDVLSVVPVPASRCMPSAPEAMTPAQSSAPKPRTTPARRTVLRPFMSPPPLLPRIRRIV